MPDPVSCPVGTGAVGTGVKRPEREASVEVKNECRCTSAPPHTMTSCLGRPRDNVGVVVLGRKLSKQKLHARFVYSMILNLLPPSPAAELSA